MIQLPHPNPLLHTQPQHNPYFYKPIPTPLTIPPSNFPFPIIPRTTLPPLLPPNTLLLNPPHDTLFTPYKLIQILQQPPLPQRLLNFLPAHPKQIAHYLLHL
ncbi:aldehyde dehydrogenase family protein, partial [Staphylococcus epidermidis]|uniref:aldehyde dehydrogenase family protein n=1 Tax=Staphylococcus epidermidis TaxID=1282 RepID=UPI00119EF515